MAGKTRDVDDTKNDVSKEEDHVECEETVGEEPEGLRKESESEERRERGGVGASETGGDERGDSELVPREEDIEVGEDGVTGGKEVTNKSGEENEGAQVGQDDEKLHGEDAETEEGAITNRSGEENGDMTVSQDDEKIHREDRETGREGVTNTPRRMKTRRSAKMTRNSIANHQL